MALIGHFSGCIDWHYLLQAQKAFHLPHVPSISSSGLRAAGTFY